MLQTDAAVSPSLANALETLRARGLGLRRGSDPEPIDQARPAVPTGHASLDAALELAARIAAMPSLAVRAAKAAILDADERSLREGLARERVAFFGLFDTDDQAEGMAAFTQKRPPAWSGR